MTAKKPSPLGARAVPKRCPVCGASSYSRGGIHPQCAARQLDRERMQVIKTDQLAAQAAASVSGGTASTAHAPTRPPTPPHWSARRPR